MALLDHIARCNRWDPAQFLPLSIDGQPLGLVRRDLAARLQDFAQVILRQGDQLVLAPRWRTPAERTLAFREVAATLAAEGWCEPLRHEDYPVLTAWGAAPVLLLDRAVVPALGVRAFGVHVNGVATTAPNLSLWIARRAADKAIEPGKLDNMVAGGQPAGLGLAANVIKEAGEEAGLPEALARQARPVGAITYCMAEPRGLKRDTLFVYDLMMPQGTRPIPVDGEVESFTLMAVDEVLELLRSGFACKFNVALVLIDFMIRHGVLTPDLEPDYLALVAGLRQTARG
jgi:isopentenyldiphosphate isomerase